MASATFTKFSDTFHDLGLLLDAVKQGAAQGKAQGSSAYGDACSGKRDYGKDASGNVILDASGKPAQVTVTKKGAKDIIGAVTVAMDQTQLASLSGLGTDSFMKNDVTGMQADALNSAYAAWDASASKYMKGDVSGGDAARAALQARLQEFDLAVAGSGSPTVQPDQ